MKILSVMPVVLAISCSSKTDPVPHSLVEKPIQSLFVEELAENDCFDVKMEVWFAAFNRYQNSGYAMKQAHSKAWTDAVHAFRDCESGSTEKLMLRAKE